MEFEATKFVNAVNEVKDAMIKSWVDASAVRTMSAEDLEGIQSTLKLIDAINELMVEMAKSMDDMNIKLDELVKTK